MASERYSSELYYEWYTCARFDNNYNYDSVCIGPFISAMEADKHTDKLKGQTEPINTILIPVCKFMPTILKQKIVKYKLENGLKKYERVSFFHERYFDK